jgi:hypothetical protein
MPYGVPLAARPAPQSQFQEQPAAASPALDVFTSAPASSEQPASAPDVFDSAPVSTPADTTDEPYTDTDSTYSAQSSDAPMGVTDSASQYVPASGIYNSAITKAVDSIVSMLILVAIL